MASWRREAMACRSVSRPSGVRVISRCGAPAAVFPSSSPRVRAVVVLRRRCGTDGPVQHVHRGLAGGQRILRRQRRDHRVVEPGPGELRRDPRGGLIDPSGPDRDPGQHAHDPRGPLRRHVPVAGQQHRRGVQHRPAGHRARVRHRRRRRERDRPAARAHKARQRPPGHLTDDLHVDHLRPPGARRCRSRAAAASRSPQPAPPAVPSAARSRHEAPRHHPATVHRPRAARSRTRHHRANRQH
jgi:hypothetical protein